MINLRPIEATHENFKTMGQVINIPNPTSDTAQLKGEGFNHYAELAFFGTDGPIEFGITMFNKRIMEIDCLEQHAETQELLLALDGPFVMPVAPMIEENGIQIPDEKGLFAIRVEQGQGIIFNKGFWHWAPFPLKYQSSVLVGFAPKTWDKDIIIRKLSDTVKIII